MSEQALNEKLLEWAGLFCINGQWFFRETKGDMPIAIEYFEPNFIHSLDACFKWLMPEFFRRYGYIKTFKLLRNWADLLLDGADGINKEAALTLCLVINQMIERLIDGGS